MSQSLIAEVDVVHPDLALTPTIEAISDLEFELESQPVTGLESPALFYAVKDTDYQRFESVLADDHTVDDWQVTMELADCRIYQVQHSSAMKVLTPTMTDFGVRVLAAESAKRGWRIRVHAPDNESLGAFWKYCREEGINFDLQKIYSTKSESPHPINEGILAHLTERQREVARTVARMGYYDQEGAGAKEVAAELGISPSTLSTHLRRIMAKVFDDLFDDI